MRPQWVALAALALVVPGCGALPSKPLDAATTLSAGRIRVLEDGPEGVAAGEHTGFTVYPPCGDHFDPADGASISFRAYEIEGDDLQPYRYSGGTCPTGNFVEGGIALGFAYAYWGQTGGESQAGVVIARVTPDSAVISGRGNFGAPGTLRISVGAHSFVYEGVAPPTNGSITVEHCYYMDSACEAYIDESCGPSNSGGGVAEAEHVRRMRPR